ncbi:Hvo_1808 family surface protein [Halosolutus gelatinilyticus]|uniref:Hvo_1808 family surface protein n=1 Tax=Halosolutus gelatinilyticus TaxID=2931975 RepID=UPI001FF16E96|nr:Hvo_1808 family surface protein [Halosolutus gelatinilyticus]
MGRARLFAAVALVVLSGCALPGSSGQFDTDRELGAVDDYAHDDEFAFDASDGLTERQLEAVKYRSMARIEVLRGLKYERDVELEVIDRAEYRERRGESNPASRFDDELWRGAFVVDEGADPNRALDDLYGDAVQGYYANDRIVIVTDDPDEIRIDRRVLAHELAHALQDQHFGLGRDGETIDERRAELGIIEGEAEFLARLYDRRCGGTWQCLPDRDRPVSAPDDRRFNVGLFLSIYAPYSEGPTFVSHLREADGWRGVDRAHDERPASTAQLIHPERYPDTRPVDVEIEDRSTDEWDPITDDGGEVQTETIGEATLFATLVDNEVVDPASIVGGEADLSPYNYSHSYTDGWAGDAFQAYADGDRTGHVWRLRWESTADADEFADAYRELLGNNGAERVDDGIYRIAEDESFTGAYRVTVAGDTVTIVGAPTVDDLDEIRAEADADASISSTPAVASPATVASSSPGPAPIGA